MNQSNVSNSSIRIDNTLQQENEIVHENPDNKQQTEAKANKTREEQIQYIKNIINAATEYENLQYHDENTERVIRSQIILHNEKIYKQFRKDYDFDVQQFSKLAYQGFLQLKRSSGKSPCFFISTTCNQYMLKSLKQSELKLYLEFFEQYVKYIKSNEQTFIVKYFGHIQIGQRHFLLMKNALQPKIPPSLQPKHFIKPLRIYDLKGSAIGRTAGPFDSVQKDNNFGRIIVLSGLQKLKFLQILQQDTQFLQSHNFIDYSVLLGVTQSLQMIRFHQYDDENDTLINLEELSQQLQDTNRFTSIGLSKHNELVYVQIIDFLTQYGPKKRAELILKGMKYRKEKRDKLSVAPPQAYQQRMYDFFRRIFRVKDD